MLVGSHLLSSKHVVSLSRYQRGFLTLSQAWEKLDWGKQAQYPYVVIDPLSPSTLQYLDKTGYLSIQKVCLSKDKELLVVATPDSLPPKRGQDGKVLPNQNPFEGTGRNSPFKPFVGWMKARVRHAKYFSAAIQPSTYVKDGRRKLVSKEKAFVYLLDGMVLPHKRNLVWLLHTWGSLLYFWSGLNRRASKLVQVHKFAKSLLASLSNEGSARLVVRMKANLFAILSYLAGRPLNDSRSVFGFAIAFRNGLPAQLPVNTRSAIRRKSKRTVRVWCSLLNAFKAFSAPYGELDYSKIQSPRPVISITTQIKEFLPKFWGFLTWSTEQKTFKLWSSAKTYLSVSAGPNHKVALFGAALDAYYWTLHPKAPIWKFLEATYRYPEVMMMRSLAKSAKDGMGSSEEDVSPLLKAGKLSVKEEAAGKLRIFAIVDYWTQVACEPLHKWIFSLLGTIPTDGTFNQEGAIASFSKQEEKEQNFFCYDLTSATDMISIEIYEIVFGHVLTPKIAKLWLQTLTDREFARPSGYPSGPAIRYTRGQPMGALSSWGALAVVHHFVVQYAASRVGLPVPNVRYRIVGDDLVIAGETLAKAYIEVCDELQIPLNLKKSFTSNVGFFNFCQQSILAGENISPVSLKEELQVRGAPSRLEMAARMLRRGWGPTVTLPGKPENGQLGSALRLLFLPRDWKREWSRASKSGELTPHIARAVRLLLGPNPSILKSLGVQTGALQAWFLSLGSGGGLLAPYRRIYDPTFGVPDALAARFIYELADSIRLSITQKDTANLASMKVFQSWVSANSEVSFAVQKDDGSKIKFKINLNSLISTIMTWRDTNAWAKANAIKLEVNNLINLCRVGPVKQREAALARMIRLDREFPTLPDFRLPEVMMGEVKRRYLDDDLVDDAVLIEFATRIARDWQV